MDLMMVVALDDAATDEPNRPVPTWGGEHSTTAVVSAQAKKERGVVKVLVVDDDPGIRSMLELSLTLEGFDVSIAEDGAYALECARIGQPDVILLDIMMPVIDGYGVLQRLKDGSVQSPPIIMLTAKADDQDIWEGWQRGADSYITKPLNIDILLSEIARVTSERWAA